MKKILIAGGSGFIGKHLINRWQDKEVAIVSRKKIASANYKIYSWTEIETDGAAICREYDLIINLTGANIAAQRWSDKQKQTILQSRIFSTQLLTNICSELNEKAPPLFNASAVGIYDLEDGDHPAYTESSKIDFTAKPNFLAEVARAWEKASWPSKLSKNRIVNMRFAVVLAKDGGALKKMALPFYFGLGGIVGSGQQILSWVHIDDLINAIEFLYSHSNISGPVNIVAPNPVSQKIFAETLAKTLQRPAFLKTPAFVLKFIFGQMGEELLLKGQKAYPEKLIEAGFKFQYPELETALANIFKS